MTDRESWREVIDRIIKCHLCVEYIRDGGASVPSATGWTNLGEGPEPCECNVWGMPYLPLSDVLALDKEERLTSEQISNTFYEAKASYQQIREKEEDDSR